MSVQHRPSGGVLLGALGCLLSTAAACSSTDSGQDNNGIVQLPTSPGQQPPASDQPAAPAAMEPTDIAVDDGPPAAADPAGMSDGGDAATVDAGMDSQVAAPCAENEQANPADADPCTAPLRPGEDRLCEFEYGGETRKFYLYAPPSYDACAPAALVVDCHGASESAEVHIGVDRFSADAPLGYGSSWRLAVQGDNAIVVTPEGIGLRWSRTSDPDFLNTVTDMVEEVAQVDPEKRYITGISMGGMITVETGCADTNRWRGMSTVAMLSNTCSSIDRPQPYIGFHATGDALTSYSDSQDLAEVMAGHNGCTSGPETVEYGGPNSSPDVACFAEPYGLGSPDAPDPFAIPLSACPADRPVSSCQVWSDCDDGVEVRFCTVAADTQELGGHLLYRNDTSLALGPLSWQFFKRFWN